jgi:ATP-dependent Lon protease
MIPLVALPEKNVCLLPGSFVKLSARRDLSPALFHTIIEQFSSSIESGKSTEVDEADVVVGFEKQETSRSHNVNRFRRIAVSAKVIEFRQSSSQGFVVLQILSRVRIVTLKDGPCAQISPCTEELGDASKVETLLSEITKTLESLLPSGGKESSKMMMSMKNPSQPGMIADILGSMLTRDVGKRQVLLETLCVEKRLEIVLKMLKLLSVKQMEKSPSTSEVESTYLKKLEDNKAPKEIVQAAQKEIEKLQKMSEHHPGYSAQLVYLDTISSLPWNVFSASNPFGTMNLDEIEEDLDRHHFGMVDVKKRILEYIAVRILNQDQSSARAPPIVLLVGPPGTGKTSIARSIASCLKKPFQRISLGGVRDEAEIRGHRRTYIGAMPGKFITAMNKCGQSDPVILVDELDKISSTIGATRGDPASAMLELFDPEQNKEFMDHYIGLPFDMSRVTFISTANTTDTIPKPLLDRTEIIHLPGYTIPEKKNIARQHLLPKVLSKNGLNNTTLVLSDTAMEHLITGYTMEGGVRGLYKALDALCRYFVVKTVRDIEKKKRIWNIDEAMIEKILGPTKFSDATHQNAYRVQSPGTAAGLVWTPYGGSVQYIECIKVPHKLEKSRLVLTGRMGEVLNESATLAMNWVISNLTDTFADSGDNLVNYSIHIHLPSGAVKKDGPSAGVTILVALVSLVTGACVRSDTALTGEITLRGHVLPVGGIREKLIAAHSAGLSRVIIPSRNLGEAKKCIQDDDMRNLTLIPVSHVEQAIENAFKTPIMLNHAEYIHTAKL